MLPLSTTNTTLLCILCPPTVLRESIGTSLHSWNPELRSGHLPPHLALLEPFVAKSDLVAACQLLKEQLVAQKLAPFSVRYSHHYTMRHARHRWHTVMDPEEDSPHLQQLISLLIRTFPAARTYFKTEVDLMLRVIVKAFVVH